MYIYIPSRYLPDMVVHKFNLCLINLLILLPSATVRLIDPTNDEPRLLKLKDWPTCDDFSEKLPKRYNQY